MIEVLSGKNLKEKRALLQISALLIKSKKEKIPTKMLLVLARRYMALHCAAKNKPGLVFSCAARCSFSMKITDEKCIVKLE
jgi:hypothetical protein